MRRRRGLAKWFGLAVALLLSAGAAQAEEMTINGSRLFDAYNKYNPTNAIADDAKGARLVNSLAGELMPNTMATSISAQREFRRALPSIFSYSQTAHYQDRADAGASSSGALANISAESYYTYCPTTMCAPGSKWVMWDVPFFTKETHKAESGHMGYEQNVSGFATGISRMIGEASAVGLAVGYDSRRSKLRDDYGSDGYNMDNRGDTLHTALFGGTNIGHFFIDGYAGFSRTWNRMKRGTDTPNNGRTHSRGKFHDNVYSAGLKVSYVWILGNDMRITPSIGLDASHVRMSAMNESAEAGRNPLQTSKSDYTSVQMPIMMSINKTFSSCFLAFGGHESLWTPEVRGGYVPQFGAKHATVDMNYGGLQNFSGFTAESTRINRSYGTAGAGLKIKLRDKYIFGVDYDYSFSKKWDQHSLTAMYGVSF